MEINNSLAKVLTPAAAAALEGGKGNRFVGGSSTFVVGTQGTIEGIDYITSWVKPEDMADDVWNNMTADERQSEGRKIEYFAVITSVGNVSVSSLLADHSKVTEWKSSDEPNATKVEAPTNSYIPKSRNIEMWVGKEFMQTKGKTLKCVGIATVQPTGRQRFAQTHKLFVVE